MLSQKQHAICGICSINVLFLDFTATENDSLSSTSIDICLFISSKCLFESNISRFSTTVNCIRRFSCLLLQSQTAIDFAGDVGGVVGLWLGGSMLSLFETFDLLFLEHAASYCRCKKRLRQPSPAMNKADHFDLPVVLPHSPHTPLPMQPDNQVVQPFDIKPLNNGEADVYKPATWHLYYDKS